MSTFFSDYPVSGGGVSSLNGLTGALTLVGAGGITITPSGTTITITGTGGTVTSVGLADDTGLFTISDSPVTTSGTLTLASLNSQAANTVFAAPNGSSGSPTFRQLVIQDLSFAGQPNGVATLDSSGKVPASELPSTLLEYQGLWDPATNTPTLQDSTGTNAFVYQVNTAFAGPIAGLNSPTMVNFQVGNIVIYSSAAGEWQQAASLTGVTSVNGAVGAVTVNAINQLTGDVTAGPATQSQSVSSTIAAIQGTTVSGTTGTGNVVFSASPTFTGTITAAALTLTTPLGVSSGGTGTGTSFTQGSVVFAGASGIYSQDNSKLFWDDTSFRLGIGTSSPVQQIHVVTSDTTSTAHGIYQENNAAGTTGGVFAGRHSRGTHASPTAIQNGDALVNFQGYGYDGSSFGAQAPGVVLISASAPSGFTTSDHGTQISLNVTPNGSTTRALAAVFGNDSSFTQYSSNGTSNLQFIVSTGTTPYAVTWPTAQGTGALTNNGSGTLSWSTPSSGTVTSVALADSTGLFNITGSPVTSSGTLTLSSFQSQSANTFLAAPNGSAGAPTFRTIVAADVPTLNQNTTGTAANITATSNSTLTTLSALSLPATQLSGVVSSTNGGTGVSNPTAHGVLIGEGSSPVTSLVGGAGTLLAGQPSADPTFSTSPTLGTPSSLSGGLYLASAAGAGRTLLQNIGATAVDYNFNFPTTAGSPGQVLTSQGGSSTPMTWTTPSSTPTLTVTAQTSNYAVPGVGYMVLASGAAFTVTLPTTAGGTSGGTVIVKKTDSSLSNIITMATFSGSQFIQYQGTNYTSINLTTQDDEWQLISDGSNWQVVQHKAETVSSSPTTISLSATAAYVFTIPSSSITAGTIYTNNGNTYTVTTTTASSTSLTCSGTGTPTTSGTLTFVSGSPSGNLAFSARTITGAPAVGTTTTNAVSWYRSGQYAYINYQLVQTGAGTAGSGDYIFYIPAGLVINTTAIPIYIASVGTTLLSVPAAALSTATIAGILSGTSGPSFTSGVSLGFVYSTSSFRISQFFQDSGFTDGNVNSSGPFQLAEATLSYNFTVQVPILNWLP